MRVTAPSASFRQYMDLHGMDHVTSKRELFEHIAFCCKDHDEFRKLLDKAPPERRRRAYEMLAPHLRFSAKPLDVYIAENQNEAERKQLPVIGLGGKLLPFKRPEIESEEHFLEKVLAAKMLEYHLTVICRRCAATETFHGGRKIDAIADARNAGWGYEEIGEKGMEICPKCLDQYAPKSVQ